MARAQEGIPYRTEITGVEDDLRDLIVESSRLVAAEDTPPAGLAGLQQRAESDVEDFQRVLRSEGYYGARIRLEVEADERPAIVRMTIEPGPRFRLTQCAVQVAGAVPETLPRDCDDIGVVLGVPAEAETVIATEARLLRPFLERGYPDVAIMRRVIVDHADSSMHMTFTVTPGPQVRLGNVTVMGTERTDPAFLEMLRTWEPGATYDVRQMDAYRERLNGLDLFDSVILSPAAGAGDLRPVELTVHERPPRTFGGGVRFATDRGLGVTGYWEHRNFFGGAERLHVDAGIAEQLQNLTVTYSLPHRPNPDQRLDFLARALHEITDAYRRGGGEFSAALTMPVTRYWRARFGGAFQAYEIEEDEGVDRRFTVLGSAPTDATYDDTDSLLDPTGGARFVIRATPVGGTSGGPLLFLRLDSEASGYLSLDEESDTVLAGRIRIGTIFGATVDAIPPDWRFYSGGGGSVRGYGYQRIGPLDADGDPIGGRSIAEIGGEIRQRISNSFGAVGFVEGGSVGRTLSGFEDPRYGAGLGIRYYTAFGPIRADLATPINPRPGDATFQLYISIGQAF
jgi:translocation and assembly module TamA